VSEISLTAFPDTEKWLREACADAELDKPAFQRRLARCDLVGCRGMCCYDGVYVDGNTAEVLQRISQERAADFEEIGVTLPGAVITEGIWRDHSSGLKTATKPVDMRSKVSGFPGHFDDTSCVFRADDGRCSLQTLGAKTGHHPWFYKPVVCWLHPINVSPERITIYHENTIRTAIRITTGSRAGPFAGVRRRSAARPTRCCARSWNFSDRFSGGT